MHSEADSAIATNHFLRIALLDYCKTPGKYQVTQRQPAALFAVLREILQISIGREGVATGQTESLHDAARFFVRTGLLYPGADHYALLGLERRVENAELKDRYRLMMRLLHPDFAGPNADTWPADAAVRVNRAYDVLSSPVRRKEYDERLPQPQRKAGMSPNSAQIETRESRFKQLAVGFAVASVALIVVAMFATGTSDTAQLVQRIPSTRGPTVVAAQETFLPPPDSPTPAPAPHSAAAPIAKRLVAPIQPAPSPRQAVRIAAQVTAPSAAVPRDARVENIRPPALQLMATAKLADLPVFAPAPAPLLPQQIVVAPAPPPAPALIEARLEIPAAPPIPVATVRPLSKPAPTLKDAQPLLSQLLQVMESGRGERILNLLDAEARSKPSAQALSRQYDSLVDGARPVRVSHVELKAEPGDGRLLVVGQFRVLAGEQAIGAIGKRMVLRAEFASRDGNVVLTGLSGGSVN